MTKYKPFYTFSDDGEEVEIKVTAKKVGNRYVFKYPKNWQIDWGEWGDVKESLMWVDTNAEED